MTSAVAVPKLPQTYPGSADETMAVFQEVEIYLAGLKRHYNSFSLINARLPTEVLSEILLILIAEHQSLWMSPVMPQHRVCFYGWLRYTHVCSHWRKVALGSARLWSQCPTREATVLTAKTIRRHHLQTRFSTVKWPRSRAIHARTSTSICTLTQPCRICTSRCFE